MPQGKGYKRDDSSQSRKGDNFEKMDRPKKQLYQEPSDNTRVATPKERANSIGHTTRRGPYSSPSALSSFQTRDQMNERDRKLTDDMRERRIKDGEKRMKK